MGNRVRRYAMATMFEQLMKGLDEIEAYLQGEREGYRVTVPGSPDEVAASTTTNAKTKCGDSSASLGSASV